MSVAITKKRTMCVTCSKGITAGSLKMVIRRGSVHMRCWKQQGNQSASSYGFNKLDAEHQEEFLKWFQKWRNANSINVDKGTKRKREEVDSDPDEPVSKKSKLSDGCDPCVELPFDAWYEIFKYTDLLSLVSISSVNKQLLEFTSRENLWKRAAEGVFPNANELKNTLQFTWKKLCVAACYNGATKQTQTGPCAGCGQSAYWDVVFRLFVCHRCDATSPFNFIGYRDAMNFGLTDDELDSLPARKQKEHGFDYWERSTTVTTYPMLLVWKLARAKQRRAIVKLLRAYNLDEELIDDPAFESLEPKTNLRALVKQFAETKLLL